MRLQYLAGMGLNFDQPVAIYNDMLALRRFPSELFSGSEERINALRFALSEPRK